jgi:hypothetical protein
MFSDDEKNPQWKVYKVGDGMTPTCRNHLSKHGQRWKEICAIMGLKLKDEEESAGKIQPVAFMVEMFYHLLTKWVAVDDQVCNMSFLTQLALSLQVIHIPVLQCR